MAVYIVARWGASSWAHCFSMALEIHDGPGALCGLTFVSAFVILSGVKVGNLDWLVVGGPDSTNCCSCSTRGISGGKKLLASCLAFCSLADVDVLYALLWSGYR